TSLTLTPSGGGVVEEPERGREVAILDWTASERTVRVGQGPEGVLRIPENVNIGWSATLDGEELEPLRLDSWQQGFKLPAGEGGEVELSFAPDATYRLQLALGAIAALLVFGVAVVLEVVRGPGPRRVATVRVSRWLGRGRRSRYAIGAVVGYLFAGVPLVVGLLLGVALIRRGAARVLLPSALVIVATTGQAISSFN